jgi:predicted metal-dependent peptidase
MATNIQKAKVQMLLDFPFFGTLLMKRPLVETKRIPTACVDKHGQIMYNPDFVAKLSVEELKFLLGHEVMHVVYAHLSRLQKRDPKVWNIACDATINELLVQENVGRPIEGAVRYKDAQNMTADTLYKIFMEQKDGNGGSGDGDGDGEGGMPNGSGIDDILPEEAAGMSKEEAAQAELNGKLEIAQAAQAARMQGKLSGALAGIVDEIINTKLPWWELLERYMVAKTTQHQSWNRPNKRYAGRFYLPRRESTPSMGTVVIGVDTSGSISDKEMAEFFGHVNGIIEQCNPSDVHVVYCTARVEHADHFERCDYPIPPQKNRWCGGTDMRKIIDWVNDEGIEPDVCIVLTDGYTPYPESAPCDLLWVITDKGGMPESVLGEAIYAGE